MQPSLVCSTSPRHEPRQALRARLPQTRRPAAVRNPCISPPLLPVCGDFYAVQDCLSTTGGQGKEWSWTEAALNGTTTTTKGEMREEPRRRVGGSRAGLEEESDIYTQHTRVSPRVARTVAATRRGGGRMAVHRPPLFSLVSPLTLPAVVTGPGTAAAAA